MKIFKTMVLAGVMAAVCGTAAQADTMTVTGEVPVVNSLAFNTASPALGDMSGFTTDQSLGTMTINNNDQSSFTISVSSERASKLVRYASAAYVNDTAGDTVGYTITFANATSGTLGSTDPGTFDGQALTLTSSAVDHVFATATEATVDYVYNVTMLINGGAIPDHLFATDASEGTDDVYRDVITVTIADND